MAEPTPFDAFREWLTNGREWIEHARCRKIDKPVEERVEMFFPYRGSSQKEAKAVCRLCPVKTECDEYAVATKSTYGLWGGKIRVRYRKPVPIEEDPFV